ncbi:RNA polymerase sigma factor [bacterium]|nr:RNA polymerase sigma factor [bacterium]
MSEALSLALVGPHFRERGSSMSLVERLRSGQAEALQAFIEETQQRAYGLAFSILQDPHQCQDALQDAYLTVLEKIHQLRDEASLRSWFSQILVNRCRQQMRLPAWEEMPERVEPPRCLAEKLDVQAALAQLTPIERTILTLREVMELSYQEIAQVLGIPLGTVRSRLANARARLLQKLSQDGRAAR